MESVYESKLARSTVKGIVTNHIIRYSFLFDLATTFMKIMQYNYATLYMFKHGLGELVAIKNKMQNKINFVNHAEWPTFCAS